jgi:hypothetical protein
MSSSWSSPISSPGLGLLLAVMLLPGWVCNSAASAQGEDLPVPAEAAPRDPAALRDPATLLPDTTFAYLEFSERHPVARTFVEGAVEGDSPGLLRGETPAHPLKLVLAVSAPTQGAIALIQSPDAATLDEARAAVLRVAPQRAHPGADRNTGGPVIENTAENTDGTASETPTATAAEKDTPASDDSLKTIYREIPLARHGAAYHATLPDCWVWAQRREDLEAVIDRYLDQNISTLADDQTFQTVRQERGPDATGWVFLRLPASSAQRPMLWQAMREIWSLATDAHHVAFSLYDEGGRVPSRVVLPWNVQPGGVVDASVAKVFPGGPLSAPLLPNGTIFSVTARLNSELVSNAVERFGQPDEDKPKNEDAPEMEAFQKSMPALLPYLKEVGPEVQILVARQTFPERTPEPEVTLPAVAIVLVPTRAMALKGFLQFAYASTVRRANTIAKKAERPEFELRTQRRGSSFLTGAIRKADQVEALADKQRMGRELNSSPALAVVDGRFIMSSSYELAAEMVEEAETLEAEASDNTRLRLDLGPLSGLRYLLDQSGAVARMLNAETLDSNDKTKEQIEAQESTPVETLPDPTQKPTDKTPADSDPNAGNPGDGQTSSDGPEQPGPRRLFGRRPLGQRRGRLFRLRRAEPTQSSNNADADSE